MKRMLDIGRSIGFVAVMAMSGCSSNDGPSGNDADADGDASLDADVGQGGSNAGGSAGQAGSAGEGGSEAGGSGGSSGSGGSGGSGGAPPYGPPGQSCNGMTGTECQGKSCCSSILVPGGSFPMGRSKSGMDACPSGMRCWDDELPEHEVTVSDFYLDEFEVTVGRFRRFVESYEKPNAGAGAHPKIANSGWKAEWDSHLPSTAKDLKSELKCDPIYGTWRDTAGETEQHPINCVNWYVAFAFCAWDGGRLPTEAEWEKAAAGGDENRLWPWGSAPPNKTHAAFDCLYDGKSDCTFADVAKAGMLPSGAGRWGHKDLAGNMTEWVLDVYDKNWYGGQGNACTDCVNLNALNAASARVFRDGTFGEEAMNLRAAYRNNIDPRIRGGGMGFRCARTK